MRSFYKLLFLLFLFAQSCNSRQEQIEKNPLLNEFQTPHQTLPFNEIMPEHLLPAFKISFKNLLKELKRVSRLKEAPSFENTILPIENEVDRITNLFTVTYNLNSANTNNEIQEATQKMETKLGIGVARVVFNQEIDSTCKICIRSSGSASNTWSEGSHRKNLRHVPGLC